MHIRIEGWWLPDFTHINVRVARPGVWWWRGAPWARLSFPVAEEPKSATEGLRWMTQQLAVNMRSRSDWPPPFDDTDDHYEAYARAASLGQFS